MRWAKNRGLTLYPARLEGLDRPDAIEANDDCNEKLVILPTFDLQTPFHLSGNDF